MTVFSLGERNVLSSGIIERTIRRKSAGVYVLSALEEGVASARRVGRSDDDIAEALRESIGLYSHFAFVYAPSPKGAYEVECEIYHSLRPPENPTHPAKPTEMAWVCPVCGR
jgi:hypothetical protein